MNNVVIVTGGSAGIGAAIVNNFAAQGHLVYNLDIKPGKVGIWLNCDVTKIAQVKASIAAIISQHQRIDVLVCNAGMHLSGNIEQTDEETLDRVLNLNVKSYYYAIQACLPTMKQAQQGSIVLLGSDQCKIAKPHSFAYNLSKHAIASMAKTTAIDYAAFNIRVNAVCAGTTETPLYHQAIEAYCERANRNKEEVHQEEAALQPLGRIAQPKEIADLVDFLAGNKSRFITGSLYSIDGGYTAQ